MIWNRARQIEQNYFIHLVNRNNMQNPKIARISPVNNSDIVLIRPMAMPKNEHNNQSLETTQWFGGETARAIPAS